MEHPDHQAGMVSDEMIYARMCEEIEELRAEIERLRARVEVLERVREAAQAWREDMTMPTDHIRSGVIGCRLINALAEVKP
jgi:uncharacterized small protein (DUF1192 family)